MIESEYNVDSGGTRAFIAITSPIWGTAAVVAALYLARDPKPDQNRASSPPIPAEHYHVGAVPKDVFGNLVSLDLTSIDSAEPRSN
jgi:hypothetical protein